MRLQKIRKKSLLAVLVLASAFCIGLWFANRQTFTQTQLLIQRLSLLSSNVVGVAISPGNFEENNRSIQLSSVHVETLLDAMRLADNHPVGGHNEPIYECIFQCELRNGSTATLLGSIHKSQETDLYITDKLWTKKNDGTYYRGIVYRARIPKLGNWLIEIDKRGLLSKPTAHEQHD